MVSNTISTRNSKTALTKKDYLKTSLRAYFLQNGFNYGNYQGLGYANVLYPALKKIFKLKRWVFQFKPSLLTIYN